ncbi:MAG TPA: response regulator transcription factor [Gaiellaceae bacterium]|nr:response regulator transcription factor [Gaiellaceae bacterium]
MSAPEAPVRVLLVEDSDVYRESLVFLLGTRADLEIAAAVPDGASAIRACREHAPDVVVLDYRLPDIDGAMVAADLPDDVAIVFLSASAGQDEYDAASSAGAALVRKDEGIDALVRAVRRAAGRMSE